MRSHSRHSHKRSSRRSSCAGSSSCCRRSEPEQNFCNCCTRESRNSKCSGSSRRVKCKTSHECNLKCQDKNTGVAKPLNVHLKLQLINDRNRNKKSDCLCAKYFQMLNACYGGPPFGPNLYGQGEDRQICEKPCSTPQPVKKRCSFFNCRKPDRNIEPPYPCRSSSQQQYPSKIQVPCRSSSQQQCPSKIQDHADSTTQTEQNSPLKSCECYVENILTPNPDRKISTQNGTSHEPATTMYQINNTLNEITNTLQNIETKLKQPHERKSQETETLNYSTTRSSITPTIVSFFTKCVPPPPFLTLSKLTYFHNPSPTIPIYPPKKNLNCEEMLKLFNFDGRNSFGSNRCVPKPEYLNKGDVCTNETAFQTNNNHNNML